MLKSIQIKIVLAFTIVGVIVLTAFGLISIKNLQELQNLSLLTAENIGISENIGTEIYKTQITTGAFLMGFIFLMILVGIFVSKVIIAPISSLIKSAEQATKTERVKYLGDGKRKNEINDLVSAFDNMNNELKENLNEATRQKKQMETILLHMTDGIIAFNIEGDIIHINPAAKTFLNVDKESTFDEIFDKYNVDINLEKIIYLENWTSSEQKINVEDRTINLFFAPYKNENDRPAGVIVVIQDITEHVRLDSMRKRFVADVSHELKTPITSIMGYADTLLENEICIENGEIDKAQNLVKEAKTLFVKENL